MTSDGCRLAVMLKMEVMGPKVRNRIKASAGKNEMHSRKIAWNLEKAAREEGLRHLLKLY